jgi:hypothetical protein
VSVRLRRSGDGADQVQRAESRREVLAMTETDGAGRGTPADRQSLEHRVRVDVARVPPQDMVTTQVVDPPPDPEGGRSTNMEFMTRNAGW